MLNSGARENGVTSLNLGMKVLSRGGDLISSSTCRLYPGRFLYKTAPGSYKVPTDLLVYVSADFSNSVI